MIIPKGVFINGEGRQQMNKINSTPAMTSEEAVLQMRSNPNLAALVEACYFDDPVLGAAKRFAAGKEWKAIERILSPINGRTVLEVGAGRGMASFAFEKAGARVTALEPDPSVVVGGGALRTLKAEAQLEMTIVEEWGESLPFADGAFDIVFARQVLHHAANLEKFCAEMFRVLKKGGKFLACREHVIKNEQDLKIFLDNHSMHKQTLTEHAYTLDAYLAAMVQAGFGVRFLGPWESEINLFPDSARHIKQKIASKLRLPVASLIPDWFVFKVGRIFSEKAYFPGCLYTFICKKK